MAGVGSATGAVVRVGVEVWSWAGGRSWGWSLGLKKLWLERVGLRVGARALVGVGFGFRAGAGTGTLKIQG